MAICVAAIVPAIRRCRGRGPVKSRPTPARGQLNQPGPGYQRAEGANRNLPITHMDNLDKGDLVK